METSVFSAFFESIAQSPSEYLSKAEFRTYQETSLLKRPGWAASRFAAKKLISQHASLPLKDIEIVKTRGKPQTKLGKNKDVSLFIDLSLSHTGSWGAATISTTNTSCVGIDIEQVRKWQPRTLKGFLVSSELKLLSQAAHWQKMATLFWSTKEAYLKAKGVGLRQHPKTISITPLQDPNTLLLQDLTSTIETTANWTTPHPDTIMVNVTIPVYATTN